MKIIALDLSLQATGWARNYGDPRSGTLRPPRGRDRGPARLDWIRGEVRRLAEDAELAVLEGYSYGSKGTALFELGELGGVVRLALYWMDIPYVVVAPQTLKILATGSGRGEKNAVLVEAVKRLGYGGSDHNEADALWLLEAGLQQYGCSDIDLPKTHLRALAAIRWPRGHNSAGGCDEVHKDPIL